MPSRRPVQVSGATGAMQPHLFANGSSIVNAVLYPLFQVTCFLSMFGSLSIILTYAAFADLRSTSRRLLVYLSLMDFGTALANSYGLFSAFSSTTIACKIQAGVAIFTSLSSFLWTIGLGAFLFATIVLERQTLARRLVVLFHVLAWGIPIVVTSAAAALDVLGLDVQTIGDDDEKRSLVVTGGWCYVKGACRRNTTSSNISDGNTNCTPAWYDETYYQVWVFLAGAAWEIATFVLCIFCYFGIKIRIYKENRRPAESFLTRGLLGTANSIDRKLTFIPLVFFLLHVWSIIRDVVSFFNLASPEGWRWLIALEGIGDCGQGAANGVLFCLFTQSVRRKLKESLCKPCCSKSESSKPVRSDEWDYNSIKTARQDLSRYQRSSSSQAEIEASLGSKASLLHDMSSGCSY